MRRLIVALMGATVLTITAAQAADMPVKAPPPVMAPLPYNWTGFYIGAQIGGGWGDHDRTIPSTGFSNSYNSSGVLGGLYAGYNWQVQQFVFGLETDINWSGIKGDDGGTGGTLDETKVQWLGSLRGRLGWAWDRFMVFATGGWAYAGLEHSNNGAPGETFDKTRSGWTLGGGFEYAMTQNWLIRAEYRYYDLGTFSNSAPTNGILPYDVDTRLSTITGGIAYKF